MKMKKRRKDNPRNGKDHLDPDVDELDDEEEEGKGRGVNEEGDEDETDVRSSIVLDPTPDNEVYILELQ
jgi:hypothetical protein